MQLWAVELQRFLTSGLQDTASLRRAAKECDNPIVRAFLPKLPAKTQEDTPQGEKIAAGLAENNLKAEAALVQIVASIPMIAIAENPRAIPPKDRAAFGDIMASLTEACRVDTALAPTLALMHNLVGGFYSNTRDFAAARGAYEEARDIYAKLAKADPQTYQNHLAGTLNNLGNLYRNTRDFAAARGAYEEARDSYAKLAKADPQTYQNDLAATLNNLGNLYSNTRDFAAARGTYEEARDIYAKLAKADPQTYQNHLAGTLNNLGNLYRNTRDFAAARGTYEEARDIYAKLAKADPQTYQNDLAATLNNLGNLYSDTRDFAAARGAYEEARDIRRKLAKADPQTYLNDLAATLNNLGILYSDTRDFAAARGAYEEAIALAESPDVLSEIYLTKGSADAAYRAMLKASVDEDPIRAFSLASALRGGSVRSCSIGQAELTHLRTTLSNIEKNRGAAPIILFASTDFDETPNMVLGLISSTDMSWFTVETQGWDELFPSGKVDQDHAARRDLGHVIWQALPKPIQQVLDPSSPEKAEIWISGDQQYSAFPWELLRFGGGELDYLGLHHPLPRIGSILAPEVEKVMNADNTRARSGPKTAAIIAPHTTSEPILEGVWDEAEALKMRIPELGGTLPIYDTGEGAHDGLMRQALHAQTDILYYTGHGGIVSDEEVLVLHAENPIGAKQEDRISYFGKYHLDDFADAQGTDRALEHAPMVVLNSCLTGRVKDHGGQREDFVEALLAHGAATVIATALPIYDVVGKAVGSALFSDDVIAQSTIGDGVVEARRQLVQDTCKDVALPFWGAWGMLHVHGRVLEKHPYSDIKGYSA